MITTTQQQQQQQQQPPQQQPQPQPRVQQQRQVHPCEQQQPQQVAKSTPRIGDAQEEQRVGPDVVCHAEGPASVCTAAEREWHQQLLQDAEAAVFAEAAESDPQEGQAEQSREEMTRACAALGRQLVILSGNVRWAEEALDARTSEASTDWGIQDISRWAQKASIVNMSVKIQ